MELNNSNKENYDPIKRTFSNSDEYRNFQQRVIKNALNSSQRHNRVPLAEIYMNILEEIIEIENADETVSPENDREVDSLTSIITSQSSSATSH
ncbi:9130_t:CDS:2 [Dentiscutata erythropus]|uniref:9130_t:CDS:1 n=1 Tax=Dentiscutata erythropus TaxID=1348616 RepID=A0A9N9GE38_9GLOM|nr:9130_t:CDS:2 [Dentiscutata erythropus]